MITSQEQVTLANLADGAVVERFADELERVLANIQDPNTTLVTRTITLTVKIKPDENRRVGAVGISAKATMAPTRPLSAAIMIGKEGDTPVAMEIIEAQQELPFPAPDQAAGNITPIKSKSTAGGKQ